VRPPEDGVEHLMAQKLNFERLLHTGKPALSIADEAEYRDADRAARWLAKVEQPAPKRSRKRRKRRGGKMTFERRLLIREQRVGLA
jgi:hypothetical protein